MAQITNEHNLPAILMRAALNDSYSRGESDMSVTQLIDSPRINSLKQKHKDKLVYDVSESIWSLLGTAVHEIVARHAAENQISEERIFYKDEGSGLTLSGAIDIQEHNEDGTLSLIDWKTTSTWTILYNNTESWEKQLNLYALFIEKTKGVKIRDITVVALLRDWSRAKIVTDSKYPPQPIIEVPIKLWSLFDREQYLLDRVDAHMNAQFDLEVGDDVAECTDEERWYRPGKVAVMKGKNKKATRVFDTTEEADEFIKDHKDEKVLWVQERPGENVRCDSFCPVSEWCEQYQRLSAVE